jgi:hypothetical protein
MLEAVSFVKQSDKKLHERSFNIESVLFCDRTDLLKMTDVKEEQIYTKFCFKLGKTTAET